MIINIVRANKRCWLNHRLFGHASPLAATTVRQAACCPLFAAAGIRLTSSRSLNRPLGSALSAVVVVVVVVVERGIPLS